MLLRECAEDRLRIVCSYNADGFEQMLERLGLTYRNPKLIHHLRNGFPIIHNPQLPILESTYLPPNHKSASDTAEHKAFVTAYLQEEQELGHVSAPFPEDIVRECYGNIRSSPLGVIDKTTPPGEPQKYRLITDGSHKGPDGISINDLIDADDFPTRWHGVEVIAEWVSAFPSRRQPTRQRIHALEDSSDWPACGHGHSPLPLPFFFAFAFASCTARTQHDY